MTPVEFVSRLQSAYSLTPDFSKAILNELTIFTYPKNYLLVSVPDVARHIYYLNTGFAITYSINDGKKSVDQLWGSSSLIFSHRSILHQVPANEYIQLLEPSEVFCLGYSSIVGLLDQFPEAHKLYGMLMTRAFEVCYDRFTEFRFLSAERRYDKVLATYPRIEQLLTQDQVASYLGITPQSLSRIKRRRARKL